jgi:hypothetical protein
LSSHFRDAKPGKFWLHKEREPVPSRDEQPPFIRYVAQHGFALDLWRSGGLPAAEALRAARLDWRVVRTGVVVPAGNGVCADLPAEHYAALVRPDTQQVMNVVSRSYRVAENDWLASYVEALASRHGDRTPIVGAAGFGRTGERTLFVARISSSEGIALCLLAYNTHGGEGATRLQLVEADRATGTAYVLGTTKASRSIAHSGSVEYFRERLRHTRPTTPTFVDAYIAETAPLWDRLANSLWTRRHTDAVVKHLWGEAPPKTKAVLSGVEIVLQDNARHPGYHLPSLLCDVTDAASAFRQICDWIDHHSEACERGDFTKDRVERLALGAGSRLKQDAWTWISRTV